MKSATYKCPRCSRPHMIGMVVREGSIGILKQEFDTVCHSCSLRFHVIATPAKRSFLFGLIKLNDNFYETIEAFHEVKSENVNCLEVIYPPLCVWNDCKTGYQPSKMNWNCPSCKNYYTITYYDSQQRYRYDVVKIYSREP